MADKNKTIMGMDAALLDFLQTMTKYEDVIVRMPNRHQVLFKILGPLYRTYLKLDMAADSVKSTFTSTEKTTKTLTKATKGLIAPLAITVGLFKALTMSIFPIVGIVMAILGVMMLFVAALDQGGGALRGWLEEMPIIGEVFGAVQAAIDTLKGALTGEGDAGILAPIADAANYTIGVVVSAFNLLMGSLPSIDGEKIFGALITTLGVAIEFFSVGFKTLVEVIVMLFTSISESGAIDSIMTSLGDLWESVNIIWTAFSGMLGESGEGISGWFGKIKDLWAGIISFLENSGIFEFVGEVVALVIDIVNTVAVMVAGIIYLVVKLVAFVWPYVEPVFRMLFNAIGMITTIVVGVVRSLIKIVQALLAVFRGDFDAAGKHIVGIVDVWKKAFEGFKSFFMGYINALKDYLQPFVDLVMAVADGIGGIVGSVGGAIGGAADFLGFADGGVVSGPTSGYPVTLHGTEAVVPLPDGRSIPVTVQGMGDGGGSSTVNITVNGASGDANKLARMIGDEVAKAFRSRSRGGGFSRGL